MIFDADQIATLEQHVRETLEQLHGEIETLEELVKPVAPDRAIGRLSRLEAINEKSINEAALQSAKRRQARLTTVLSQLRSDEFGLCAECDEPIPFARLMTVPESTVCVACRERSEG